MIPMAKMLSFGPTKYEGQLEESPMVVPVPPKSPSVNDTEFTEEEAQRRFETLVKAALNTPPQPLKDAPRKKGESKARARKGR